VAEQADSLIKQMEVLIVGPDETLLIKLGEDSPDELIEDLTEVLRKMGLGKRSLIIAGDVEFAKVQS
jgi:hypothetical protein